MTPFTSYTDSVASELLLNANDVSSRMMRGTVPIRTFVRQPFTESGEGERSIVQGVLDVLGTLNGQPGPVQLLTGTSAQSQDTFRQTFESESGLSFNPTNFRNARLNLLRSADAMVVVRTSLSESGAFEVAYNIFGGRRIPMFFAVWRPAPIKTTLLRDLEELCDTSYVAFDQPDELRPALMDFFNKIAPREAAASPVKSPLANKEFRLASPPQD